MIITMHDCQSPYNLISRLHMEYGILIINLWVVEVILLSYCNNVNVMQRSQHMK